MKLGMTITGGGTEVIGNLLKEGGASSYFSFADVPYSQEASKDSMTYVPEKYGSIETSNELLYSSMCKLWEYHGEDEDLVGIGCSAVLYKKDQRANRENVAFISKVEYFGSTKTAKVTRLGVQFTSEPDPTCIWSVRRTQEHCLAYIIEMLVKNDTTDIKTMCDKVLLLDWDWSKV